MAPPAAVRAAFTPEELEHADCPLCGSSGREVLHENFRPFLVNRCAKCGAVYLSPRLREDRMRELYESGAYFHGDQVGYADANYESQESSLRRTFRAFLTALRRAGVGGESLLEIGCGPGLLLDEARAFFGRRDGVELAGDAAADAARRADRVFHGDAHALPPSARYDVVIATQVIEHVYRPAEFVDRLREHLTPGGHLVIATPDIGSFWYRLMGWRWPSFKIPEHIVFFDEGSLRRLLSARGLTTLRRVTYPHAFPVDLVLMKLGLRAPRPLAHLEVWLPATTIALCGKR